MEKAIFLPDLSLLSDLKGLCPSSIVIEERNLNDAFVSAITTEFPEASLHVIVNTFLGSDLPRSILEESKLVEASERVVEKDWYKGVCPNSSVLREYRFERIEKISSNAYVDCVWLDFLHYPTYWMLPEPDLFDTCYCERCIKAFEKEKLFGDQLPTKLSDLVDSIDGQYYIEWLQFKCEVISSFVKEARSILDPSKRMGVFAVPWKDKEYSSAVTRLLGQDFSLISAFTDYISPQLAVSLLGKGSEWIKDMIEYFQVFGDKIVPSIIFNGDLESLNLDDLTSIVKLVNHSSLGCILRDFYDLKNYENATNLIKQDFCKS